MSNPILICADCGEFFRESECGERVEAVRSEHFGEVAITRGFTKTCPHCASDEIGDADLERESLMHYVNGSTSHDWLQMCANDRQEAV